MDLLEARAADRADWHNSEQFRCFVLGHLIRAEALDHLTREDRAGALQVLDNGIDTIEAYFRDTQQRPELASGDPTLSELRDLRQSVLTHVPLPVILPPESDRQRLERELVDAIAAENYEQAAVLRDQLRLLD
ncbi:MAG TPA: hypothetical protein DCZ72_07645 [Armatimonadetes bacterium]|nr:hypothetical protein [Armatimonadota bacterium]